MHKFNKKTLMLVKLLLLERRVIFYGLPVAELSVALLSLISLFPGLLSNLGVSSHSGLGVEPDITRSYVTVQLDKTTQMDRNSPASGSSFSEFMESQRQRDRRGMWQAVGLPLRIFEKVTPLA